MPSDTPSNAGAKSTHHRPYPSLFSTQDGRLAVPRTGPLMRSPNTVARSPTSQWPLEGVVPGQGGSQLAIEQPWYHPSVQPPSSQVPFEEIPAHTPSRRRQGAPYAWENRRQSSPYANITTESLISLSQQPPPAPKNVQVAPPPFQHPHVPNSPLPPSPSLVPVSALTRAPFNHAHNFEIGILRYVDAPNATHVTVNSSYGVDSGWELLLEKIAINALHDSSARYDAPKCDEDTRVEITGEMMDWIEDRDGPKSILCITGAAGSGKSALQQTIAERCSKPDILAAAFFISSADSTRNTASAIVPTIAYQLGLKHDGFRNCVATAVKHDRHIFSRSLQSQMDALIVRPFKTLRKSKQLDADSFPYVILIDGLDECSGEPNTSSRPTEVEKRRQAEDRQAELLAAIQHCILDNDLPFRVLIASRPEWAIRTALEPGGHLRGAAYHIQLSDNYDASGDMRKFLRRRFETISLQIGDSQWFTESDIETLVQAASRQFIYVAVVYKFISERRTSPAERLRIVLTWVSHEGQMARPFETLDRLYTSILLAAKDTYEAVDTHCGRDFSRLFGIFHSCSVFLGQDTFIPADALSALLGIEARGVENIISDLRSLVTLRRDDDGDLILEVYHKSFSDFLWEESRAKDFYVSDYRVQQHLIKCCLQRILEWCPLDLDPLPHEYQELPQFDRCRLQAAITELPYLLGKGDSAFADELVDFTEKHGWHKFDKLLPFVYPGVGDVSASWQSWLYSFGRIPNRLKVQNPEIAAVITGFFDKWERDKEEWQRQMDDSDSSVLDEL